MSYMGKFSVPRAGVVRFCTALAPRLRIRSTNSSDWRFAYEREHVPSLQGFLHWLTAADTEVKRDFAARPRDEVRV